ncbi:MAG: threonylcarbamoyl-AMP synthase [Verrucomicrobia bacterium A1]|nr:MAG: threonylcarbamoyl-AMP synthase [Verrucomicrobia bacterium A1]
MPPRILRVDPHNPDEGAVRAAVAALAAGRLVILPTETVYGLCADPRNEAAMAALCTAKGRPEEKKCARLVAGLDPLLRAGAILCPTARALAARFWPGPLTLVLDTPGGPEGFRWPDHAVALAVLRAFGGPLVATSANRSGEAPALTAPDAVAALGDAVEVVLDSGPVPGGVPSAVVRIHDGQVEVLRAGAIPEAQIFGPIRNSS